MVERVSAAEQLANCFTATGARVKNANTDSVFARVLGDAYKNVTAPSQEENPSQQVEARNTPEGIVKWLEHRDIYPEPDDKALVDYLYADKHNYSGRLIVYQNFPDGSEFYYPPKSASFEEKMDFINAMKPLSFRERMELGGLVTDKFGATPFHPYLQRVPMSEAENISNKQLFDELRQEVKNHLAKMLADDPAREQCEREGKLLDYMINSLDKK